MKAKEVIEQLQKLDQDRVIHMHSWEMGPRDIDTIQVGRDGYTLYLCLDESFEDIDHPDMSNLGQYYLYEQHNSRWLR